MNSFDFSAYENYPENEETDIPSSSFDFSQYLNEPEKIEKKPKEETSFLSKVYETGKEGVRIGGQYGARALEGVAGSPGELLRGLANLSIWGAEKIGGRELSPKFKETLFQTAPFKLLPTVAQWREKGKKLTGGILEPKNSAEEIGGDLVQLSSLLASPSNPRAGQQFVKDVGKAVKIATAGMAAKHTIKGFGGGETSQALGEGGAMFLTALYNPKAALNYANDLRAIAKNSVPIGQTINVPHLVRGVNTLERELQFGDMTPTKQAVLKSVQRLKAKISSGRVDPAELMEFYKDINEKLNAKNLFEYLGFGDKGTKQILRQRFDKLRDQIRSTLTDYGNINPRASEAWLASNEVYDTLFKSRDLSSWIANKAKYSLPPGLFHLMQHPENIPSAAVGAGIVAATTKAVGVLSRLKNPKIRKLYTDIFKQAAEKNAQSMNRSLKYLNEELEKENQ
jgi:hypothetical protein